MAKRFKKALFGLAFGALLGFEVLFLDLDGVLHPADATEFFDASCLAALRRLLEMNCELVLSSTWRCKEALRKEACPGDRIWP